MRVSFKQHAIAFAVAAAFPPSLLAQTLPTGGQVAKGQATISQSPGAMQIHQSSDKAVLNWQSFSIGAGGRVNFSQPAASSVALNRVLGNNPSQIFGSLTANGRVFLVNSSGVYFAPGASVSVGSLVASTLSITDEDFLAGRYVFTNAGGAGRVVNEGSIVSNSGYTALLGPQVRNDGVIFANAGSVALAAGDRVSLDMVGDNLIRVSVDQAALDAATVNTGSIESFGGNVLLSAHSANALLDTVLNTEGYVRASSMTMVDGDIVLDGGHRGHVAANGQLSASRVGVAAADGLSFNATVNADALDVAVAGDATIAANVFSSGPIDIRGSGAGSDLVFSGNNFFSFGPLSIETAGDVSFTADASRLSLVTSRGGQSIAARSLTLSARDGGGVSVINDLGGDQSITLAGGNLDVQAIGGMGFAQLGNFGGGSQVISLTGGESAISVAANAGDPGLFASASINSLATQRINARSLSISAGPGGAAGINADGFGSVNPDQQVITLVGGDLRIRSEDGGGHAGIGSWAPGGQFISVLGGGSVDVRAESGMAAISANAGNQTLAVAGGGNLELRSTGAAARVELGSFSGSQTISVHDGDRLVVDAADGEVSLLAVTGAQTLSITGDGLNALQLGSGGALGRTGVFGAAQKLLAGNAGESGSITVIGPDAVERSTQIVSNSFAPGEVSQSVETSGTLRVAGGVRPGGPVFPAGFFHTGAGEQTIKAGRVELQGGVIGAGNAASIVSAGGGRQRVDVAGELAVLGGPGGVAELFSNGPQEISAASIRLVGGADGANNGAFLTTAPGASQHIEVPGRIEVLAGEGGVNNGAGIIGRGMQTIVGRPDIFIAGGAGGNASVQGLGGLQRIEADDIDLANAEASPVNSAAVILGALQRIDASGDVRLVARSGTGTASGVRIGGAGAGATDLVLTLDGNLLLQGGTSGTNGAALGGTGSGATGRNDVTVNAGGDVILDGAAGGGGARIGSSALTALQDGDISVTGRSIVFTGTAPAAIRTLGKVELSAGEISQGTNGLVLADALSTSSGGSTHLGGLNQVSSFSGSANGDLVLRNTSSFLTLGPVSASGALSIDQGGSLLMQATEAPLVVRGGLVSVATGGDFRLAGGDADGAHALLSSGGNIDLTVGGTLRLDEGAGKFSWAKVQTESRDGVITLSFPNLTSGGFYVNGAEGDTKDGKSGFFIIHKPAKIGSDLLVD